MDISSVCFSLMQVKEVAAYLWKNNHSLHTHNIQSVEDVEDLIQDQICRDARFNASIIHEERRSGVKSDVWLSYTGTAGYYCIYDCVSDPADNHVVIGVTVLADLQVGKTDVEYATVVVDKQCD